MEMFAVTVIKDDEGRLHYRWRLRTPGGLTEGASASFKQGVQADQVRGLCDWLIDLWLRPQLDGDPFSPPERFGLERMTT